MSGRRPNQDYFENDSDEFDDAPFIQDQIIEENVELSFDDLKLIELHKMHGNKWKKISTFYENKDDSYIKNHFYSLLRRALRKLNSYIKSPHGLANKHKPLKLNFVFKLTNLAESERNGISNTTSYGILLYQFLELKDEKVEKKTLTKNSGSQSYFPGFDNQEVEKLLKSLKDIEQFFLDHNLNKKGKSKKKCPKKIQLKKEAIRKSLNLMELEGESGYMKPSFSRLPSFDGLTSSDQNEGNRLRKESKGSWSEPFKSSEEDSDDKVCCMDDYAKTMLFPWSIEQPDGLGIIEVEYPNADLNNSILDQDSSYDPVLFK